MSTVTPTDETIPATPFAPLGWERRPDGGKFFTPGKRHLYDASQDLAELSELRTLCGTAVPREVLRFLRNGRSRDAFSTISVMREKDLSDAAPCVRCERAAVKL